MIKVNFKSNYKVLHFTSEIGKYVIGGISTFINEFYRYHPEEVGFVHCYREKLWSHISTKSYPGQKDILALPRSQVDRLLREISFDVAVIHWYALDYLLDKDVLRGKPIVYVIHSIPTTEPYIPEDPFGIHLNVKQSFEKVCARADLLICVSEAERRKLLSLYPELAPKTKVIHNGIHFDPGKIKEKTPIRDKRKMFGYIGRMDYRKGILECLKELKDVDGKIRIASGKEDIEYFSKLKLYIEAANLEDKIEFLGWCQGPRKDSFFQSVDALIVPSLYEPFGYIVLEAMQNKVPVICSTGGGIPEIVGSYKYCYDPYEKGSLNDCIRRFQTDPVEEIEREAEYLFARMNLFTSEKMVREYMAVINDFMGSQEYLKYIKK